LITEFPKIEHVHVVLDEQRHQFSAEFVVQHKGVTNFEAKEICDDLVAAIEAWLPPTAPPSDTRLAPG